MGGLDIGRINRYQKALHHQTEIAYIAANRRFLAGVEPDVLGSATSAKNAESTAERLLLTDCGWAGED
jgi:hypothetical protein